MPETKLLRPALFLDRDGTIGEELGYVNHIDRFQMFPYAAEAIRELNLAKIPVIVKLTPNISNIVMPARAAVAAGADALSLINTINSIIGVDLDTFQIVPNIGGKGGHGGYAGPAVKPVALNMLSALGTDAVIRTACGDCSEPMLLEIAAGKLKRSEGIIHFAVPAHHWWDNIGFT